MRPASVLVRLLDDTGTRTEACLEFGDWARDLCLFMGTELETACNVGTTVSVGLEKSWTQKTEEGLR